MECLHLSRAMLVKPWLVACLTGQAQRRFARVGDDHRQQLWQQGHAAAMQALFQDVAQLT